MGITVILAVKIKIKSPSSYFSKTWTRSLFYFSFGLIAVLFRIEWLRRKKSRGQWRSQRGAGGATAPSGRNSAPPPCPPNEITLCTEVYGELPFWVPVSPPCSPLSPPCRPLILKSLATPLPVGNARFIGSKRVDSGPLTIFRRCRNRVFTPDNLGDSHFPLYFGAVIQCEITRCFHEA